MYSAYGDESLDKTKGPQVYALASVFGHKDDWDRITGPWTDRLGDRVFHAADCESGYGDFDDMEEPARRKLYRDLTQILVGSSLIGHGGAIKMADYRRAYPSDFEHAPYLWLFGDLVQSMAELAAASIPREPLEVIFDQNKPIEYNAGKVYELARRSKHIEAEIRRLLPKKVSFASRKCVGIQVADLYARETMKQLLCQLTSNRTRRGSFAALTDTRRFRFKVYESSDFEQKKEKLAQSGLAQRANMAAYRQWLEGNKLIDCLSNRIAHLHEFPELWQD